MNNEANAGLATSVIESELNILPSGGSRVKFPYAIRRLYGETCNDAVLYPFAKDHKHFLNAVNDRLLVLNAGGGGITLKRIFQETRCFRTAKAEINTQ